MNDKLTPQCRWERPGNALWMDIMPAKGRDLAGLTGDGQEIKVISINKRIDTVVHRYRYRKANIMEKTDGIGKNRKTG
ncbi:hypothetical protein KKI24_15465 [bacterium]|nr:hypothetical protein [bacterium]